MPLLLIGGHTRNIGKTSLVVDLLRAFPDVSWTAVKITQYGHGVCSLHGELCGCAPHEHPCSLTEEHDRSNHTDTSRFLVAGAARSLWLRARQGQLAEALPLLRDALSCASHAIIESNSLLSFLHPALYLAVLDPADADFKDSARLHLHRADAFVLRTPLPADSLAWPGVSSRLIHQKPHFYQPLGFSPPRPLLDFVRLRVFAIRGVSS